MHVIKDVHADRHWLQSAIARNIASSHESLHKLTSIPSRSDNHTQKVVPNTVSQGINLCLEF